MLTRISTLFILSLTFSVYAQVSTPPPDDTRDIDLIIPLSYQRPSSFTQTVKSKIQASAADLFKVDIQKKVVARIQPYKNDLLGYYGNEAELNKFVDQTVKEGIKRHFDKGIDDNALILFYQYLGNSLIGGISNKILEKEGITDFNRRRLWTRKLLNPFDECIIVSINAQYDANHCLDALTTSLVPSAGIGIVYELSKNNLNSTLPENERKPFNNKQVETYKECIGKTKNTAADVKFCALFSMKKGVAEVTNKSLSATLETKVANKDSLLRIKNTVWREFERCNDNVGSDLKSTVPYTEQFNSCLDLLVKRTGTLIVEDTILNTPAVKESFPADEVQKLAKNKSDEFAKCANEQLAKNQRANGMLDISPCEGKVTNDVTYTVVKSTFLHTAKSNFSTDTKLAQKIGQEGLSLLDKCWKADQSANQRDTCLKTTILSFSNKVASLKLDAAIPKDMKERKTLAQNSLGDLQKCLQTTLPDNVSSDNQLSAKINSCSSSLTRNVALKVAEAQIRETAKSNLTPAQIDAMINTKVKGEFALCIGEAPDDQKLDSCAKDLTISAAKDISATGFSSEIAAYIKKAGGLTSLNATQAQVDQFLKGLKEKNDRCINAITAPTSTLMNNVNSCIKNSIKDIALFMGEFQLNKSLGDMYKDRASDKAKIVSDFQNEIVSCLSQKDNARFTIDDFTKNLDICSNRITQSTTLKVGNDQIETTLKSYLSDRPGQSLASKRAEIKNKLISNLDSCLKKNKESDLCVNALKKEATQSIVLNYAQVEVKSQLNADKMPKELESTENALKRCTTTDLKEPELQAHLDECVKQFAIGFAKNLGELKLNYLLKTALGSEDFTSSKRDIDQSIFNYNKCLDDLNKLPSSQVTENISTCTDYLTSRGMNIVRRSINTWMTNDQKDAATNMIKAEFANFLPCISALLPTSPYTPQLAENIDSNVKPLARLLAHYIEYNPENAKQTLSGIIKSLSTDLSDVAKSKKAKEDLLNFLYESGGMDQFIKAIVRGTVKDAIEPMPLTDIPSDLRSVLLDKKAFETMFSSKAGKDIELAIMNQLLRPALLDNVDMGGDAFKANMTKIKDDVVKLLINSPEFGEKAISMSIQTKINEMGKFTKFMAKVLYGGDSLKWDLLKGTPEGKKAEEYIKLYVLEPKFKGDIQTPEEQKRALEIAEELVTKAVKSYSN